MRSATLMVLALGVFGAGPLARAASSVESSKVFTNGAGLTIEVVELKPEAGGRRALVRVSGSRSEFDGLILPTTVEVADDEARYRIQRRGREIVVLDGQREKLTVWYPGLRERIPVRLDDGKTKALKGEDLVKLLTKQPSLDWLTKFNRAQEQRQIESEIAETVAAFNKRCETHIPLAIEWSTISDDRIKELSIPSYCGAPAEAMDGLCDGSNEAKRTFRSAIKAVRCRFGQALKVEIDRGTLTWTTSADGTNQTQFVRDYLQRNL